MNKSQRIRNLKFQAQGESCYCCCQPMWREKPGQFAARHGLTVEQAQHLMATAEHLKARCDGGRDTKENIVAACLFCNGRRHQAKHALAPEAYLAQVRTLMKAGAWHGLKLCQVKATAGAPRQKMTAAHGP